MIGVASPEVFFIEIAAVSFEAGQIFLFECSRPMMFELLLDVMDGFRYLRDAHAEGAVPLLPSKVSQIRKVFVYPP